MAYYNPDQQGTYYNPDIEQYQEEAVPQIETQERAPGGIGKAVGSLAAFAIGSMVLKGFGKKGINYGIRALSSLAKTNRV